MSKLDDDVRTALSGYGVTDVADLRTLRELERHGPGLVPAGVDIHHLPFVETTASDDEAPHEHAFQRMMTDKPDGMSVADAAARYMTEECGRAAGAAGGAPGGDAARFRPQRPRALLRGQGPHGFAIATVLEAAGVGRDGIVADYLRSNSAVPRLRQSFLERVRQQAPGSPGVLELAEAQLTDSVLGVRESYLETAWRTADDEFGSLRGYLGAAGLTDADIDRLRTALHG